MHIEYKNNKVALMWKHKITVHTVRGRNISIDSTQHIISLTKKLVQLVNIRKLVFIYKHPETGEYHITTQEPPLEAEYEIIKRRSNSSQSTIQLPQRFLKLARNQTATIRYYPSQPDYYNPTQPNITISIEDIPIEEQPSTAQLILTASTPSLQWDIKDSIIPYDLESFLTLQQKEEIKEQKSVMVNLNVETEEIRITQQ